MSEKQPNILLITCDQLRGDLLGCAGHPIIQTPNINMLARHGVRFSQAYSTTPICIPARSMVMAGQEGGELGITQFLPGFEIPVKETLPQALSDSGYQTKAIGKMHFFPERRHYGFDSMSLCEEGRTMGEANGEDRGYDDYELWLAEQGYAGQAFSHGVPMNGYATSIWQLPDNLHPTEWIGSETCKEIKRRDWSRPFFMWASFTAPHPPLTPLMKDLYIYDKDEMPKPSMGDWVNEHPSFHDLYLDDKTEKEIDLAIRAYYALVTQVDRQISRILGTLREEGLLKNTWIIFTSDHGDSLGDHGLWRKTKFLKGSTNIPYIITPPLSDESIDSYQTNTINNSVVGLQDILPTCLEIAKVEMPSHVTGRSLLPLVSNPDEKVRETILGEVGPLRGRTFMLTDGIWKYIWYEEDGGELLFNIQNDPDELKNLTSEHSDVKQQWQEKLIEILSLRKNDPAVKDNHLHCKAVGFRLTEEELTHRLRFYPYDIPVGHH